MRILSSCFLFLFYTDLLADDYLDWSYEASEELCFKAETFIWTKSLEKKECVRYFSSDELLDKNKLVVFYFYGDRDLLLNKKKNKIKNNTVALQKQYANSLSASVGIPVIVVARPGTYGSSGLHMERRNKHEFEVMLSAVNEIKKRYSINSVILSGHSGGATVGAALLTLGLTNVKCAVLSSGTYNYTGRQVYRRMIKGNDIRDSKYFDMIFNKYDPLYYLDGVPYDEDRTLYIVADKRDKNTPYIFQKEFYMKFKDRGHQAFLVNKQALAPQYHDMKDGINSEISRCID